MGKRNQWHKVYARCLLLAAIVSMPAGAQSFKVLVNFNGTDGEYPVYESLVQGLDGDLYGTTQLGGVDNCGTVFKMTSEGTLNTLYSSSCADPRDFSTPVMLGSTGDFYGVAGGGTEGDGLVFKITPKGVLTTTFNFDGTDGAAPDSALILGADGNFYGTTAAGGTYGYGTVFKLTPNGVLTTIHSFNYDDGSQPVAALVLGTDGALYGTTQQGGQGAPNGYGTVFKITPGGTFTGLHTFDFADGSTPTAALVQGTDGNFYGTTYNGGTNNDGTIFKITPHGGFSTLHDFDGTDGTDVLAPLILGTDGNFYGTTSLGGTIGNGTVFKINPGGTLTTIHNFGFTDGASVFGGLVESTNGKLYGTTCYGGSYFFGTVFRVDVGLGPFVRTLPGGGQVGTTVRILGTNLTGTSGVTFNGTPAMFTVQAPSVIKAMVPAGATTGTVQVITPTGTLSSNAPFRVRP